ncbi:MAG TPA: T9SS type A sorting domain-containing protein [Chitinophagales bacterium]|nr:T9SS type A sorting domain-containing protein [Chitinophagales bacterium]
MKYSTPLLSSILIIALSCSNQLAKAQAPSIAWQKTAGGSNDEDGYNMIKTTDGNYVVFGTTNSVDGDFSINRGDYDAFAIKFDGDGNFIWSKTYGGSSYDDFTDMLETGDGGFLAAGTTASNDGDVHGNHGGDDDIWIASLNASGDLIWSKCFGGSGDDLDYQSSSGFIKTSDNNFMFAALSNSSDGDVPENKGDYDAWLVKINKHGKIIFSKTYGGSASDNLVSVVETSHGKYVIGGSTFSTDGDVIGNHGGAGDYMLMRLNKKGDIKWSRCYGGSGSDFFHDAVHGPGSTVVFGGSTNSSDGNVTNYHGGYSDSWVVKIKSQNGDIIWANCFGDTRTEACFGLIKTSDGYVSVSAVDSGGYCCFETWDAQAIKMDENGNELWSKVFGGTDYDLVNTGVETNDGGLMLNCVTSSTDGDITNYHGGPEDGWLVKLNPDGERISFQNETTSVSELKNYPNPFSTSTTISFSLSQPQKVSLKIFDVNGRLVLTLADKIFAAGENEIVWTAKDENAGIYFLQLQSVEFSKTEKLSVTK